MIQLLGCTSHTSNTQWLVTTTLISAGQDNVRLNMTGLQHGLVGCFLCLSSLTQGPYGTPTSSPMDALTSFSHLFAWILIC